MPVIGSATLTSGDAVVNYSITVSPYFNEVIDRVKRNIIVQKLFRKSIIIDIF